MSYARRVDENQAQIVAAFRKLGCSVAIIGQPVDILIGYGGECLPAEIKDGDKPPSARKLTKQQRDFFSTWTGGVRLIRNVDDVEAAVKGLMWRCRVLREAGNKF